MRQEVKKFAEMMEETLARHDYKPGWKDCTFLELFFSLKREVNELWETYQGPPPFNVSEMIGEAIDVANFSMMIVDGLGGLEEDNEEVS